ncbi:hypothetical protein S245_063699, partial [Arachis hypogaea]
CLWRVESRERGEGRGERGECATEAVWGQRDRLGGVVKKVGFPYGPVGVVRSHTEGPRIYSIGIPPSNIGEQFGQLLKSGRGTDVSFEVNGEIFAAHKLVLAARSPVFRAQICGPVKDQNVDCINTGYNFSISRAASLFSAESSLSQVYCNLRKPQRISKATINEYLEKIDAIASKLLNFEIDEELLQEVVNMGFDRNQLVESLCNRIQNEVYALHSLLSCLLD